MAISGKLDIQVGLPNESTGSDSLYSAFNKTVTNFNTLFNSASPYSNITNGIGIVANANPSSGILTFDNAGVLNIIAGSGIGLSSANGNVEISFTGNVANANFVAGVTSVGVNSSTLTVNTTASGNIVSSGNIIVDLPSYANLAGTYTYPTVTVDQYGRVTTIANANSVGTVTSVNLTTTGIGLQVSGGPITTAGNINIINTGVTRLSAGTGINLSGSNGNVTVSSTSTGVTSVGLSSSSLTVTNSPITTTGTIGVEIPANVAVSGKLLLSGSENLASGSAANLDVTASYFSTVSPSTATLAAGTTGQIKTFMMVADTGDMVITVTNAGWKATGTGTITFGDRGAGCTLQYINSKWFCIGQNGVTFA